MWVWVSHKDKCCYALSYVGTNGTLTKSEELLSSTSRCRRGGFGTQETATLDASRWSPPRAGALAGWAAAQPSWDGSPHCLPPGYWDHFFSMEASLVSGTGKQWWWAPDLVWYIWVNEELWVEDRVSSWKWRTPLIQEKGTEFCEKELWFPAFLELLLYLVCTFLGGSAHRAFGFVRLNHELVDIQSVSTYKNGTFTWFNLITCQSVVFVIEQGLSFICSIAGHHVWLL